MAAILVNQPSRNTSLDALLDGACLLPVTSLPVSPFLLGIGHKWLGILEVPLLGSRGHMPPALLLGQSLFGK